MAQLRKVILGNLVTAGVTEPIPDWAWTLGGYAGAWLGGAGVGYVVARNGKGAVTGGLTTSGIWAITGGLKDVNTSHPAVTAGLLGVGAVSLFLAWQQG